MLSYEGIFDYRNDGQNSGFFILLPEELVAII